MTRDVDSKTKGVIYKMKRRFTIGGSMKAPPVIQAKPQNLPGSIACDETTGEGDRQLASNDSMHEGSNLQVLQVTSGLVKPPERNEKQGLKPLGRARGLSVGAREAPTIKSKPTKGAFVKGGVAMSGFGKMDSYHKLEKLGEGTYACVFKGISAVTGCWVALKEITIERDEGAPCTAIREISLLRQLKHENIVTLHDVALTSKILTLVFEFVPRDLKKTVDDANGILPLQDVKSFLSQLLLGLDFFHKRNILHRDLKPQNLLIHTNGILKIADFGLARATGVPIKTFSNEVVTLWYRPPDVLMGSVAYTTTIDIWSAGCIFAEMISGLPLFPGANNQDELIRIFEVCGTPTEDTWPGVSTLPDYRASIRATKKRVLSKIVPRMDQPTADLLDRMLVYIPENRISAREALDTEYFTKSPTIRRTKSGKTRPVSLVLS